MLEGWAQSADVDAWLVPINPVPPPPFHRLLNVKFVRTAATQLCYWPLLVRELRRADIAHVFSASYTGFLLSTVPAVVVARALGKPVVLNYHSGEAPDHLAGSRLARALLRRASDVIVVPSRFLFDVFRQFDLKSTVVFNSIDTAHYNYRARSPLRPHLLSTRNFETLYNVGCTLRAFARVQKRHPEATLTLIGSGSQDNALRALARSLGLQNVTFVGRVHPRDMARLLRRRGRLRADALDRQHAAVGARGVRVGSARRLDPRWRCTDNPHRPAARVDGGRQRRRGNRRLRSGAAGQP